MSLRKNIHIFLLDYLSDIKTNPEADVLIMTTEILMNYLFTATTTTSGSVFDSANQASAIFNSKLIFKMNSHVLFLTKSIISMMLTVDKHGKRPF